MIGMGVAGFGRYLAVVTRQSVAQMLTYRLSALFVVVFGLLFAAAQVAATLVFFRFTHEVGGWGFSQFLVLVATFDLLQHLYQLFFVTAHEQLMDRILSGELDFDLVRPIDSLVYCSLRSFDVPSVANLLVPAALLAYGVRGVGLRVGVGTAVGYVALLGLGLALLFLLNQCFVALAFWVERPQRLAGIPEYLFDLARRPAAVYPSPLRVALTFALPVLAASNLPVEMLFGGIDGRAVAALVASVLLLGGLVRVQWKLGLRRYASAGG